MRTFLAAGYAAVGETEVALDWLETSFREEGGDYSLRHPWFDPLRSEARFRALWDELGLPGPEPVVSVPDRDPSGDRSPDVRGAPGQNGPE